MLAPGVVVGRHYRIVRPLGRGGMGEVYEALQEPLSRRVALKTIIPELALSASLFTRFRREAESAAALGHPNIVQVTDFQSLPNEPPLLVMELLEGLTLKDVLEREGKLEPGRAAFIAMQILSGLAAAHRAGIIHRDIKPGNIFLMSTLAVRDLVKVVDFGVAKLVEEVAVNSQAKVTAMGQVLGTLAYMAPEQASGIPVDHRADLYAVGATLYHALSGMNPIEAMTPGSPRVPLSKAAPWIDGRLAAVIDRALEKSPGARWSSAEEMADALSHFADGAGQRASSLPLPGVDKKAQARLEAPTTGGDGIDDHAGGPPKRDTPIPPTTMMTPSDPFLPTGAPVGAQSPQRISLPVPPTAPMAAPLAPSGAPITTGQRASYPHPVAPPPQQHHASNAPRLSYDPGGPLSPGPQRVSHPHPQYISAPPPTPRPLPLAPVPPAPDPQQLAAAVKIAEANARSTKWIVGLVVGLVILFVAPIIVTYAVVFRAVSPSNIEAQTEKGFLQNAKLPACPAPEACKETHEDHGVTFPVCTKKIPLTLNPLRPGEMILVKRDGKTRIAAADGPFQEDGQTKVTFVTSGGDAHIGEGDVVGRLCDVNAKRVHQ